MIGWVVAEHPCQGRETPRLLKTPANGADSAPGRLQIAKEFEEVRISRNGVAPRQQPKKWWLLVDKQE